MTKPQTHFKTTHKQPILTLFSPKIPVKFEGFRIQYRPEKKLPNSMSKSQKYFGT